MSETEARIARVRRKIAGFPNPFSALTAYDYPSARFVDEAGIDFILVGDSLGMVVAGMEDTTGVTLDQMVYHTRMVRRGVKRGLLVSDLPIDTYRTPDEAVSNGLALLDAGADAVKLEGGIRQCAKIEAMVAADIPMVGHLGMLPQRVREEGGYKKKGRTQAEARDLEEAAHQICRAGVLAIVLESVIESTATRITESIEVPTIGIGSGYACTAQIRVLHDVIGAYPWFVPPFAKTYVNVADQIADGLARYREELK